MILGVKAKLYHGMEAYVEVEVYFQGFLKSELNGGDWSVSRSDRFWK
jgi:hypothetical protein